MPHVPIRSAAAHSRAQARAVSLDLAEHHGRTVSAAGLYISLVVIYGWFGGMKFTAYEAEGLTGLVGNSPLLSWTYSLFSVRDFSSLLGFLELGIGALIAARLVNPVYSLVGGLLSAGLFATTLSFMVTTRESPCRSSAFRRSRSLPVSSCSRTSACSPSPSGLPSTRSRRSAQPALD